MTELSAALADGLCLIESSSPSSSPDLRSVLLGRLTRYHTRLGSEGLSDTSSLELIQFTTAQEALSVVSRVQSIIGANVEPEGDQPPLIGTRDLAQLRTLLSIVFKWGVNPLFARVVPALLDKTSVHRTLPSSKILENDYSSLSAFVTRLLSLVFPDGVQSRIPQTLITSTVLQKHSIGLLNVSMTLGWLPKSTSSNSYATLDSVRPMTMRFLALLPPFETITILGSILSSHPTPPTYVRKLCINLLGRQLLRPQGIQGLCAAVFGEEEAAMDSVVEKLQYFAKVFTTVPNTNPQEYFRRIIPKLLALLSPQEPVAHKRAAAYAISRLLSADDSFAYQEIASKTTLSILHGPFSYPPHSTGNTESSRFAHATPSLTLDILLTLVSNADPSPALISTLLSPIVSILYSLLYHTDKVKTTDPSLREALRSLLMTWAKIVATSDGVNILWSVLESEGTHWVIDSGGISKRAETSPKKPLSLLTPQDINVEDGNILPETNILNLYPDPAHFVNFLKTMARTDISSDLFVNLLEAYRHHKSKSSEDPTRTLLYLQIIMLMQTQLTDGKSSANILCKPTHMLSFVKHVLEPTKQVIDEQSHGRNHPLLFVEQDEDPSEEGDSDDEPSAETTSTDSEMMETSITLLLSILEANDDLSVLNAPVLNDIFSLLEPIAHEGSIALRPLAREARMVITARLASTSSQNARRPHYKNKESAYDIYQKALKLLQDPILPVRAHGLLLLRQLVLPHSIPGSNEPKLEEEALIPAILSIFLQSVQDDDSYVFLNAVQGLAAMVDRFGKDVLSTLISEYTNGLDGLGATTLKQHELDVRLRIGEALAVVIRRCDEALSIYVDSVVPPLLKLSRSSNIPTALRTSSLSLLASCEKASPLSMLLYAADLAEAMIDILQIETVPAKPKSLTTHEQEDSQTSTMSSQPLSRDTKLPPLRRAALHVLSLLFRGITKQVYDESFGKDVFSDAFKRRAKTTLSYLAATDEDNVVQVMARETNEHLNQMDMAMMGF